MPHIGPIESDESSPHRDVLHFCKTRFTYLYTVYVRTVFFILKHYKQGYMFRLKVSHLQAYTIFSLPDALPILGSHNVYNCGTHLIKTV